MLRPGRKFRENQRSLQALLALQTINEPICNIVKRKFETLRLLWLNEAEHKGSPCVSCETQNLGQCPTKTLCYETLCRDYNTSERQRRACQNCSNSIEYFKTQIVKSHRSGKPNWLTTDPKLWSSNAIAIAKCFIPPWKDKNTQRADGTDCLSLLHILRNCKHCQDYFSFDVTRSNNILSQTITIVREVQHSVAVKISKRQLHCLFRCLRRLLKDGKYLVDDPLAIDALRRLEMIQKGKLNCNCGIEYSLIVQPQSKLTSEVGRFKRYPSLRSRSSSATINLETQWESEQLLFHCTCHTEDQQAYEYCMRRVQMALAKWSCAEQVYNGKFTFFASKREYLETLLDNSCRIEQKAVSDVRTVGSLVFFIVSSSDQEHLESLCTRITGHERKRKNVCVAVVSDRNPLDEPCTDQTSWGFLRRCSNISTLRADVDELFERFIFKIYEANLNLYFEQKDVTGIVHIRLYDS
ncbi:uncharacterized protein LOC128208669 [Mya arenaria]|uniref:uncharacterized protein LOC128208669 n=1 Tax=Mya arenaria TaxID=6604 RepID=UPI0022E65A66|nr:uncharacterized protein LOC128208669 [Mya arenaria]